MPSTKTAIVVLSDPQAGEEALGRLFNALAATYDFKQKGHDVQLLFQGTGTRWAGPTERTTRRTPSTAPLRTRLPGSPPDAPSPSARATRPSGMVSR